MMLRWISLLPPPSDMPWRHTRDPWSILVADVATQLRMHQHWLGRHAGLEGELRQPLEQFLRAFQSQRRDQPTERRAGITAARDGGQAHDVLQQPLALQPADHLFPHRVGVLAQDVGRFGGPVEQQQHLQQGPVGLARLRLCLAPGLGGLQGRVAGASEAPPDHLERAIGFADQVGPARGVEEGRATSSAPAGAEGPQQEVAERVV